MQSQASAAVQSPPASARRKRAHLEAVPQEPVAPPPVTVERSFDAERFNALINHPEVRPWVADMGDGVLDLSARVADFNNVLLVGEHGATLCFKLMPGIYEVHSQFLESGRGKYALDFVRAGSRWMFTHTDAYEIITRVPQTHKAATGLTIAAGMRLEMTVPDGCQFRGERVPVDIYSFRIQDWIVKARGLEEVGRKFHDDMLAAVRKAGITAPPHDDDPLHNKYVGAALEMFQSRQAVKGADFYNRYCQMVRHVTIELLALDPPTIRFDVGIMRLVDGKLEVAPC